MNNPLARKKLRFVICASLFFFVLACAPQLRKPGGEMDTPEHHHYSGMRLLSEKSYDQARQEFALALQLAPQYSQAHAGIALVKVSQGDYPGALLAMQDAWKYAETKEAKLFVQVSGIRLLTLGRPDKNWLHQAREAFDAALKLDPRSAAAYYYMGGAYKTALDFDQAGRMFKQVLDINKEFVTEADSEWQLVQKIQRAIPGTTVGKRIALLAAISRADATALFMEELKIDQLYKKRTVKTFDTGFQDPEKAKTSAVGPAMPGDIADHPLKVDIEGMLEIGVRGLETYPDGSFHPDAAVDRASYAMMVEDILIKITGDNALATKFIGQVSPFPDLRSDLPYFNAVMTVTSRGIMEPKDFTSGEFAPLGPVSGVDALLIIRKFKDQLKF
jgi:hypothetical protein